MPAGGGPRAAREIRRCLPGTRIIAVSAYTDRRLVLQMLRAGAVGYLVKGSSVDEITELVRRAARGEGALSGEIADEVISELSRRLEDEDQEAERRRRISQQIEMVLRRGGPAIVLQPIVELRSARVVGVEALARFPAEPSRPPNDWFADAHEIGLGIDLELTALTAAIACSSSLPSGVFISVNLSPMTISARPFRELLGSISGERLVVEVTEHAPVSDYETIARAVRALRARGGRLAVDDAGAGFASLRHILRLGPDLIKLDVELTRDIHADPARRALAAGLLSFASQIGALVIAEGIETRDELKTLVDLGAGYGQGYFFGRPQAPDRIDLTRIRTGRPRSPASGGLPPRPYPAPPEGRRVASRSSRAG